MTRYVVNRMASGLLTLFLFVTLLFFLVHLVVPGDFVSTLGPLKAEDAARFREILGLDQPLLSQYFNWFKSFVSFDLGRSFEQQLGSSAGGPSVKDQVLDAMAPSLAVLVLGLSIAFVVGSWLGRGTGYRDSSFLSHTMTFIAIVGVTVFPPALAVAMEQGVESFVGWRGLGEFGTTDASVWEGSRLSEIDVLWRVVFVLALTVLAVWFAQTAVRRLNRRSGPAWVFVLLAVLIPVSAWWAMGLSTRVYDLAGTMALLLAAVVILTFGEVLLVTRAAMDDVMLEDYVLVARAKGLPEKMVRDRHAARTAVLPVLSRFAVAVPYFFTGLVILEIVFAGTHASGGLPIVGVVQRVSAPAGLGTLIFGSMTTQDLPVMLGALTVVGVITLVIRVILDILHAALDPRIRFHEERAG